MLSHAIRRALKIVRENPSKLILVFTPHGWRQFLSLMRERPGSARSVVARKNEINRIAFESDAWKHDGAVSARNYASREDYVAHQREKLDLMQGRTFSSREKAIRRFRRRFELIRGMPKHASGLCLAAQWAGGTRKLA